MTPWVFRPLELLERLNAGRVSYIVVGGLAVGAWGYLRATGDLDIVPDPDPANLDRLAAVLEALDSHVVVGERLLQASAISTFLKAGDKTLVRTEVGEVDVLQGIPQVPSYAELAQRAVDAEIQGVPVRVCSLEDLRVMKRAAGRSIDAADLEALEVAHPEDTE